MKIEDFESLTFEEQMAEIWKRGSFLVTYTEENDVYDTYEVFDFYVALCYKLNQYNLANVVTAMYPDELPHLWKVKKIC